MTSEQTPSADEDHVIWLTAPEKANKSTLSWNHISITINMFKYGREIIVISSIPLESLQENHVGSECEQALSLH